MLEIPQILEGRVSANLNGVAVLCTMVERRVQPPKLRAPLLCDYAGVWDPSQETMEMPEAGKVMKRVTALVSPATVVAVKKAMEVFSSTYRPNLVSLLLLPYLLFARGP